MYKEGHINFFNGILEELNINFSEDMLVVCEEFEVVYK